ncbi:peptidase [Prescottella defluvii]|uniref:PepSY domain-containing protein n=1 Tax=Prescottella defluvii TaxID=1323361 RepID=UPI0004F32C0B|nr:peptidase [Prescottella defluvii]
MFTVRVVARSATALLFSAVVGVGMSTVGGGVAAAQEPPPMPGILGIELDEEDGRPTVEVDYVDLAGVHREVEIDLQTGRIIEDEPAGGPSAPSGSG